jgi:hypothetical protein
VSRVNEIDKVSHVRNVSFALAVAINVLLLVSYGVSAPTSNLAAVSHAVGGEGSWGGVRGRSHCLQGVSRTVERVVWDGW